MGHFENWLILAKMGFNDSDRILIKLLRLEKGYGSKKFLKEFPGKKWSWIDHRWIDHRWIDHRWIDHRWIDHRSIVDRAVKQWRLRLRACVREDGGHFEHQL